VKDAVAFLARPLAERQALLRFVLSLHKVSELEQLHTTAELTRSRIATCDPVAVAFADTACDYAKLFWNLEIHDSVRLIRELNEIGVRDEELADIYLEVMPYKAKYLGKPSRQR